VSGAPTPPIEISGGAAAASARLAAAPVELSESFLQDLGNACAVVDTDAGALGEAGRDWWPLAMTWAAAGGVPARAGAIARPSSVDEVAAVVKLCASARVPVTAAGGRSGVCGSSIPVFGGVVLDLCGLSGITSVDDESLLVSVLPGTFGDVFEERLRADHGLTVGHWPQSMALSTVGGWVACRGAGQYSTRYGKIEDIVAGLEVVLADGRAIRTGGRGPRSANGPDLTQLFVGSEGTLGVITGVMLRAHPIPPHEARAAFAFATFAEGLDACRRVLRRGATPAVLRLYDERESKRNFDVEGQHGLLVLDEGDPALVEAVMTVVREECAAATELDAALVERWMGHRNDVSGLEAAISRGVVVDTCEIAAPWSALPTIYTEAIAAVRAVEGTWTASAHQSHSYLDGACLYFTFAGQGPEGSGEEGANRYYREAWDAMTRATLANGGALSHHHGVGLNRARFMSETLGPAFEVLVGLKSMLDPNGVLNPGKLGLPSPFGDPGWP
jgi:alkyldihydroxyacetonephosphate synthase